MMRSLGSSKRVTKTILTAMRSIGVGLVLQGAVYAQVQPTGLAAHESLLTMAFFGLLVAFVALVVWEVLDNRSASRSSLDIAKLAAAAAKKQSSAGAPSGSLAQIEALPTGRPFAPPPPPPPPKLPEPAVEASPFAPPAPPPMPASEPPVSNPFAAPSVEMVGASDLGSPHVESTVAFPPGSADAGSSGGWADLLQRVRAGEPEAASFEASPPPSTEDESFSLAGSTEPAAASSSEAWEALLKRTTGNEPSKPASPVGGDVGKISLQSNFQLPGDAPAPPSFGSEGSPFGGMPSSDPPPASNVFGTSFAEAAPPPAPSSAFSLPPQAPPASDPVGSGFPFASSEPSVEASSPFSSLGTSGSFPASPPVSAGGSGGFESPAFKLPGAPPPTPAEEFSTGGFQLPGPAGGGFGGSAFDLPGGVGENPASSTLPLSDLFSKPGSGAPPAFQLPGSGGGAMDFSSALDSESANPGLGRTISLDFARGGGQKPPPPLPKTEG